jgi:CRP-like cAMP-binding protein
VSANPEDAYIRPVGVDERMALLRRVSAFGALPHTTREELAGLMEEERFPAGAQVVGEGEIGDRLFLIVDGEAEAWTKSGDRRVLLSRMGRGQVFGELALLYPHSRRQATVTATGGLVTLSLTDAAFDHLVQRYPEVRKIFAAAARRMLLAKFVHVNLLYRMHFRDARRERQFLASLAFLVTFGTVRGIAVSIRRGRGPFRDVTPGGLHIHHLVWGILLLLGIGYAWLLQLGTGLDKSRRWNRETALLYGLGSALTLDEFALWLHLQDVYWTEEGRRSLDAVIFFFSILSVGLWGGPFFRALVRYLVPHRRRRAGLY